MGCMQYFNYNFSPKVCKMLFFPSELFPVECLILNNWIGPLHHLVTWYKITHSGMQVTQWDFQNKASRTSPTWPAFMLEVPLGNLHPSMWFCTMWLDNAKDLNSMTPQDTLKGEFHGSAHARILAFWHRPRFFIVYEPIVSKLPNFACK